MIVRAPRQHGGYTVLRNETLSDRRLSWAARGLLAYLLSKPDHWRVSPAHLVTETADARVSSGRDAVYALLGELEAAGYIVRVQGRTEDGRMAEVERHIHESPQPSAPLPDHPDAAQPYPANPTVVSTEKTASTEKSKTIATRASRPTQQALSLSSTDVSAIVTTAATKRSNRTPIPRDDSPVLIELPTNLTATTGETVAICESVADALQRIYPATNVRAELHAAHGWLTRRVADRKTAGGMLKFLHDWLDRSQNTQRGNRHAPTDHPQHRSPGRLSAAGQAAAAHASSGLQRAYSFDDILSDD